MGFFLKIGKKQTLFLYIKKYNKQSIKNYRPVSILPICGKIFERLVYRNIFSFLIEQLNISKSCIKITHDIYQSFDDGWRVRGVFRTYQKRLAKSGVKVWYLNQNKIVYRKIYQRSLKTFFLMNVKE